MGVALDVTPHLLNTIERRYQMLKRLKKKRIALALVICLSSISIAGVTVYTADSGTTDDGYVTNECLITVENGVTESITSETVRTEIITETTTVYRNSGGGGGSRRVTATTTEITTEQATETTTEVYVELPNSNGNHFAYMSGYPDDTFKASNSITRAEVASILSRLVNSGSMPEKVYDNVFPDVTATHWAVNEIAFDSYMAIIDGYPDGTFKPNKAITRAEFTSMVTKFVNTVAIETNAHERNSFTDITGHWASQSIEKAADAGIISGYPDGTFRPNRSITRSEAVSIINRLTNRDPDEEYIDEIAPALNTYTDLHKDYWAYYDILEASNTHDFTGRGNTELWVRN